MKTYLNILSQNLAKFLNKISQSKLTPNHVTVIGLMLHLPVGFLITQDHLVLGGISLLLVAFLDSVDGQLARLQHKATDFGGWLDASCDRLKEVIIFTALAYHLATIQSSVLIISLLIATLGISSLISYVKAKAEVVIASKKYIKFSKVNRLLSGGFANYGIRTIILSFSLIFNQITLGLSLILVLGLITIAMRSYKFYKISNKLSKK